MNIKFAGAICAMVLALANSGIIAAQDSAEVTSITLNGTSVTIEGTGATAEGSLVTISEGGSYTLSGTLDDGQILVETEGAVTLTLDNVSLSSSTSAPLVVNSAETVTLVLPAGSENTVTDAETYVYPSADIDEPNAAIFSNDDLVIEGDGSLTVQANFGDGISTDDGLTIQGNPTITVNAADDAIRGKNYLTITGGTFTLNAVGDTLKANDTESVITIEGGTFVLTADDDGIQSDRDLTVNGGTFTITVAGDGMHAEYNLTINAGQIDILNSDEGIEGAFIVINGGDINVVSTDDGINVSEPDDAATTTETTTEQTTTAEGMGEPPTFAEGEMPTPPEGMGEPPTFAEGEMPTPPEGMGEPPVFGEGGGFPGGGFQVSDSPYYLQINGGTIVVDAEGDGLDANGSIEMTGGVVLVNGPTGRDNGALDYDGTFNISGGLLVAVGSAGMPVAPSSSSSQNSLLANFDALQTAGTLVHIQSEDGETLLTFAPSKDYQSIAFSSPELATGGTYEIYLGGSAEGDSTDGLYSEATYADGTLSTSFTVTSSVTQIGNASRMRG